jgi:FkbM family methyltransferase
MPDGTPPASPPVPLALPGAAPKGLHKLGLWLSGLARPRQGQVPLAQLALPGAAGMTQAAVRALALAVPMQGALLVRALGRYKLLLDPADHACAPHIALDGYWEWWTTAFLARSLRRGERVLEVGAGYGYFTILMADLLGEQGRVTVFEPNPAMAALLERNAALNGLAARLRLHRAAVCAAGGELSAPLLVPAHAPLAARIGGRELAGVDGSGADQKVLRVPQRPLDTLGDEPFDWVKIDLPGSAEAVWNGMQRLLDRQPRLRVVMGFDPARCAEARAFLGRVAERYPLRLLGQDGQVRPTSAEQALAGGVQTLVLRRDQA